MGAAGAHWECDLGGQALRTWLDKGVPEAFRDPRGVLRILTAFCQDLRIVVEHHDVVVGRVDRGNEDAAELIGDPENLSLIR